MKRIATLLSLALLVIGGPALADSTDVNRTFAGTQYYHIIDGPDQNRNIGNVIAGVCIAGTGSATRWYLGAEMADQQSPENQGGVGPSLFLVSDVDWFSVGGPPVLSLVASIAWLDAGQYDPETGQFSWGPWTSGGILIHASRDAKLTFALKGSPSDGGFIENIGIGPGLFVVEPERHIVAIAEGAWSKVKRVMEAVL